MKLYSVDLTASALASIAEHAAYVAEQIHEPLNALRWLQLVWDAVDSLETAPRRGRVARESAYVEYEVRQIVVGTHLLLFTVDDVARRVTVVGLRHGHRLPRPGDVT